jgi:hypothetical protein
LLYRFAMTRVLLLGFVLAATACGSSKTFPSLCTGQASAPAECNTPCNPAPGSTDSCTTGFHCSADGKCDTVCTLGGNECGKGYLCTADGRCVSDGSGSGSGDTPDACPSVEFTATKTIPSIQLLIDRSGSMNEDFSGKSPANGGVMPFKFPTEQTALVGMQGVVTQLEGNVYFGASMYPSDMCPGVFQTPRALNNHDPIAALIAAHTPGGNTPTAAAIDSVVADFMANPPPQGSPPVIVLSTDGLPNDCDGKNPDPAKIATVAAAKNAFSKGIRLFLLVVGNQFDATFKKDVANAGQGVQTGQPDAKAYTATDPATLAAAFQEIIRGVVSCDLKLNGHVDPGNAQGGIVKLNGTTLRFGPDWTITPDGMGITLLGNACNTLKNAQNPMVSATFSCGAVIF